MKPADIPDMRSTPPVDAPRAAPVPTCMAQLHDILFEGRAPSESRVEALIDRVGR